MPKEKPKVEEPNSLDIRLEHYQKGTQDNDTRRTRKNGWNEIINAVMGKLPINWPYKVRVVDPRIRTSILEKTARLLNSKLQGKVVPREGGDTISARINNAVLDFQWDRADKGGPMVEKVASTDQTSRIFGAGFVLVYWDNEKDCNEVKPIDPRDIFIDWAASHIRNAKWVQVREFTTKEALKDRGFDISDIEDIADMRSTAYDDIFLTNKSLTDRVGEDRYGNSIEVVTEYTKTMEYTFLPRHKMMLRERKNPYQHKRIPVAMLRYYPLGTDIYGESEVEPVMGLWRAIQATLCGYLETMNLSMRPPRTFVTGQVRMNTIEYNPSARWMVNSLNATQEVQIGTAAVEQFNSTYPALIAAFNTAMGDQSLGISNIKGFQTDKTATEVQSLEREQNQRDQYNQLYLGEFLKDIMLMWLANNKQYLFDDPTKTHKIIKIIGKDNVKLLQQMGLGDMYLPQESQQAITDIINENPAINDAMVPHMVNELSVPKHPVILNPNEEPETQIVKPKLDMTSSEEADLYLSGEDLIDVELYDYVPDVKSMAAGAGSQMQQARQQAFNAAINPQVQQLLATEGKKLKISELLSTMMFDAGLKDVEGIFESIQPETGGGSSAEQVVQQPGLPSVPTAVPSELSTGGLPNQSQVLQPQTGF